jgi:tetratricopeptide (TPR) repeat protein
MNARRAAAATVALVVSAATWPFAGYAFASVEVGQVLDDDELPTLDGGKAQLLSKKALANVFIFFRPGQDHSIDTLKAMADCEREFAEKPVHWAAIVSSRWDAEDVRATVRETGIRMPVLVDTDDQLYGKIGVRLHPVIGIADGAFKLLAYEPFHKINYCDRIRARIRYALHEITLADVDKVDNPPKALFPNEIKGAVAKRHVRWGEILLRKKQFEKAAGEARQVLEKEPDHLEANLLLARALAAQGHCEDAALAYDHALAIDPKNAAAAEGKRRCAKR